MRAAPVPVLVTPGLSAQVWLLQAGVAVNFLAVTLFLRLFQGGFEMKWITRENAAVDRTACPWLIRRFVDPEAEFLFVPSEKVMETASATGAIPFDVAGVELGHQDGRCSFESIVLKYGLQDPGLNRMAAIIHGADIAGSEAPPEAAGLLAIMHGLRLQLGLEDHRKLAVSAPIYDALYTYCAKA